MTLQDVADRVHALGWQLLDDSTIARYESGSRAIPPALRPLYAAALRVGAADLHCDDQGDEDEEPSLRPAASQ